jgi:hypothetical protein
LQKQENAMTLYQFIVLTENEKGAVVCKGDFVIERKENNFSILLY